MSKTLALFDFDGTITTKDSFIEFLKFHKGNLNFLLGFTWLSPYLVAMKLGLIPNWKAKEIVLKYFLANLSVEDMKKVSADFSLRIIPALIRNKAIDRIKKHQENGDDIYLVSASAENWLKPWCDQIGMKLIGTRLETIDGKITGKIDGNNCYGPEKVARIKAEINISNYSEIYAYGDSRGDKEMLALADHPHYKYF
ncbi:HAD-IB family hydrolase [Fulvivirga lutimaris]|uniref:HAD-IB family hydrolase n=1 Tax=Fulvivirga lutimaris TaxID=1819566 RepID=UPI001625D3ED|nr:HAD family hydrolase [Fulvivirga lutimaris]